MPRSRCSRSADFRTVTLVDRLLHRAEILEIQGESYRLKEAKERAATKSASRSKKRD
jgi:DNA replication protein DnaC